MKARQTMGEALTELADAWRDLVTEVRSAFGAKPPRFSVAECCGLGSHFRVLDAQRLDRELVVFDTLTQSARERAERAAATLNADPTAELRGLTWDRRLQ